MDTSGTMDDPLNDTPTLPELSFDDLLESPVKKPTESGSDDPLDLDYEREEQTLNTPKPKKPPSTIGTSSFMTRSDERPSTSTIRTMPVVKRNDSKIVTITTGGTKITTTGGGQIVTNLLNSSNYLPKIGKVSGQFVKIAPKTPQAIASAAATTTTSSAAQTMVGGKTVKTANGQLIYIKSTAGMAAVRLQSSASSSSATTTTTTASLATGTTANTTTTKSNAGSGTNKTVAIQVLRSSAAGGVTTTTPNSHTLSPSMASQLTGTKIISTSAGQVVIKAPLKTVSASPTTGTTSTTTSVASAAKNSSGKIVVQGANGKQIFVSNPHHLLKLPTQNKPLTPGGNNTTSTSTSPAATSSASTTTSGHIHTIQFPAKSGMQLVRVLNSKFSGGGATTSSSSTSTATSSSSPAVITTASSAGGTTTSSGIKILNSVPQKFTVVRPTVGAANSKFVLTQSPKKEGGGGTSTTFNPLTSKVQKTIVTVPSIRTLDEDTRSPITQLLAKGSISSSAPSTSTLSLVGKHKISEINSQIQRFTTVVGPTEAKRPTTGAHVVVMPRSMLRSTLPPPLQPRPGYIQRITVQGANQSSQSQSQNRLQSPKKLYSVLKSNHTGQPASSSSSTSTQAELKSLIICGQAQALMVQQQQHKTLQMKFQEQQQQQQQQQQEQIKKFQLQPAQLSNVAKASKFVPMKIKQERVAEVLGDLKPMLDMEAGGVVRRKHCNCSKSQCLKLYCDCFANGEFCQDCTCRDCFNSLQYEDERQRAIKTCLERNPSAFKPKITSARDQSDMRLHNKGCNCKRSGCLKNYCECYEAKIPCSSNCKCVGCRNIEDRPDLDMDPVDPKILATIANASAGTSLTNAGPKRTYEKSKTIDRMPREAAKASVTPDSELIAVGGGGGGGGSSSGASCSGSNSVAGGGPPLDKPQCNFITQDVIDATIQCMISQADECEKSGLPAYQTEMMIMEELGRCLVEIIDFSIRNTDTSYTQD